VSSWLKSFSWKVLGYLAYLFIYHLPYISAEGSITPLSTSQPRAKMSAEPMNQAVVSELQAKQGKLLDDVDQLRSQGIGRYIELPQIIVCGDQSSGKSSVLEAISRVRFPIKENTCTRFATELALRRATTTNVAVSILPGSSRSAEEKMRLESFSGKFSGADKMPELIDQAMLAMGLSVDTGTNAFGDDVLRVEISGPDQPHLTIVDLPGLTHSVDDSQRDSKVKLVYELVEKYMKNARSIILAVLSAQYDMENQIIRKLVKKHDDQGVRTLGIITKPDTLDQGSEQEQKFLQLAKNARTFLRLGWQVLRNRDFRSRDVSDEVRDQLEEDFLSKGVWTGLERHQVGIKSLRRRLSEILLEQISAHLPTLIQEIEKGVLDCRSRLEKLGEPRQSLEEQRKFITGISDAFQKLAIAAVDGNYSGIEFFAIAGDHAHQQRAKHLRSFIHVLIEDFANDLRLRGYQRSVVSDFFTKNDPKASLSVFAPSLGRGGRPVILRAALVEEIAHRAQMIRGRELQGFPNALLVGDLFREQSKPWEEIATYHLKLIGDVVEDCLRLILRHVTSEDTYNAVFREVILPGLEKRQVSAQNMLELLLKHHKRGHAITYDPDFLNEEQNNKNDDQQPAEEAKVGNSLSAQDGFAPNQGCDRIISNLVSYYKVSLNFDISAASRIPMDGRSL
jgi:GTP-binding protein EngB required for normal cell division